MRKVLLCALALLLAGCDKDFLVLHFQAPVGDLYYSRDVHYSYRESIFALLAAHHIPTDSLVMEMDEYNDKVVHLRLTDDSLSPQQLDEIREVFEAIIPARNAVTLNMKLRFDADQAQGLTGQRQGTGAPPRHFDTTVLTPQNLHIALGQGIGTPPHSNPYLKVLPQADDQMLCTLEAGMTPTLPFYMLATGPGELGSGRQGLLHVRNRDFQAAQVPVHLQFEDAALRRLVDNGTLQVAFSTRNWLDYLNPDNIHLHFVIGPPLISAPMAEMTHARARELHAECNQRMDALGRPFSFFFGEGVDRLVYVGLPARD